MFTVYKFIAEVLNLFYSAQPQINVYREILTLK